MYNWKMSISNEYTWIQEIITMDEGKIDKINLEGLERKENIYIGDLKVDRSLSNGLGSVKIYGNLRLENLDIGSGPKHQYNLRNLSFTPSFCSDSIDSYIGGDMYILNTKVVGDTTLQLNVKDNLEINKLDTKELSIHGEYWGDKDNFMKIGDTLKINYSNIKEDVSISGLKLGKNLELSDLSIGKNLVIYSSKIGGGIHLNNLDIKGEVRLTDFVYRKGISLKDSKIKKNLAITTLMADPINLLGFEIKDPGVKNISSYINFSGLQLGGKLIFEDVKLDGCSYEGFIPNGYNLVGTSKIPEMFKSYLDCWDYAKEIKTEINKVKKDGKDVKKIVKEFPIVLDELKKGNPQDINYATKELKTIENILNDFGGK